MSARQAPGSCRSRTFNHHQAPEYGQSQQDAAAGLVARVKRALHFPAPPAQRWVGVSSHREAGPNWPVRRPDGDEISGLYVAVMHSGISNMAAGGSRYGDAHWHTEPAAGTVPPVSGTAGDGSDRVMQAAAQIHPFLRGLPGCPAI